MELLLIPGDELPELVVDQVVTYNRSFDWSPTMTKLGMTHLVEFLVVMDGDQVAAYTSFIATEDFLEVHLFFVAPDYRRQGLASALLEELELLIGERAIPLIILEVREGNWPARTLYEDFGFQQVNVRVDYYRNPMEDALVLVYEPEELLEEEVHD